MKLKLQKGTKVPDIIYNKGWRADQLNFIFICFFNKERWFIIDLLFWWYL